MQIKALALHRLIARTRKNHNRYAPQVGVLLNLQQHIVTTQLGQVEIEENEVGSRGRLVIAQFMEEFNRARAILDVVQGVIDFCFRETLTDQIGLAGTILDKQDLNLLPRRAR